MALQRFKDASIRTKLYGTVVVLAIGLFTILALALWLLSTYQIGGPVYRRIIHARDLAPELIPSVLAIYRPYLVLHTIVDSTNPEEVRRAGEELRALEQEYRRRIEFWKKDLPDGPIRQALEQDTDPPAQEVFRLAREELLPLATGKDKAEAHKVLQEKIAPRYQEHLNAVARALDLINKDTAAQETEAREGTAFWQRTMWVVGLAVLVGAVTLSVLIARTIIHSTRILADRVREMAGGAGDLTARVAVDSRDEFGQLAESINALIARLQAMVGTIRQSSLELLSTASEIAATARQQEGTAQGLSASTTEVAAAVREISATGQELSRTMEQVYGNASQAADLATSGRAQLGGMEGVMQQLVQSTASISGKLATIREKADNINVVVTTITKVADQTNLLSINAAIEAEKAGEYGRGFLVVAREIRRLADQTAVATLDIENIVRLMQEAVTAGVMQMDKFADEVRGGVGRIAEINAKTGRIIEEVQGLSGRFQAVNEGMHNQSTGASQISEAMAQIMAGTQQTQATLEEFNRATGHLRAAVEALNQEICAFRV
jgi:methyl-accepting chemotaxis protein WspA